MGNFAKTYQLPFDVVLYDISYANVVMYSNVIPTYNSKTNDKEKESKKTKSITPSEFFKILKGKQ